jgi:stage II sporulation protein D
MSPSWPLEALKAQAVCARTYVMASRKHSGFDVCTTECCQVYQGIGRANATTDMAVDQTAGQYMTYNGELCVAYYSSSDGGATENSENVWNEAIGYLRGVVDPYEADIADTARNIAGRSRIRPRS